MFLSYAFALIAHTISTDEMKALNDEELATRARLELPFLIDEKSFEKCVPAESRPYSKIWSNEIQQQVFTSKEIKDLMKCDSVGLCAFNFTKPEKLQFESIKTPEGRKQKFMEFYRLRATGKTPPNSDRALLFVRKSAGAFDICEGSDLDRLLQVRPEPLSNLQDTRLSVVQYTEQTRPTTRLLQGKFFKWKDHACYAETLLFSDHYDNERVEVWMLDSTGNKSSVEVRIRNRIDLLNSWFRRLNKPTFQRQLNEIVAGELERVGDCLAEAKKR